MRLRDQIEKQKADAKVLKVRTKSDFLKAIKERKAEVIELNEVEPDPLTQMSKDQLIKLLKESQEKPGPTSPSPSEPKPGFSLKLPEIDWGMMKDATIGAAGLVMFAACMMVLGALMGFLVVIFSFITSFGLVALHMIILGWLDHEQ